MAQQFTDCMVDLETTGVQPDRHGIIQIAAVKFNIETREISHDFFNRCLTLPKHRHWDEGTREWWLGQKEEVLADIFQRAEDPRVVIKDFAKYAYPANHLRFWSKPTHFDFTFMASYLADEGLANPFHFRQANDLNSFLRGLHYPNPVPELEIVDAGDAHNALNDCFYQIDTLYKNLDYKQSGLTTGRIIDVIDSNQ